MTEHSLQRPIVLVAPDPARRAWLRALLAGSGYAVTDAESVREAQQLAQTRPGALLLYAGLSLDDLILTDRPPQVGSWGADQAAALRTDVGTEASGFGLPALTLGGADLAEAERVLAAVRRQLGAAPEPEPGPDAAAGPALSLLSEAAFAERLRQHLAQLDPAGPPLWLVQLHLPELSALYFRHGPAFEAAVAGQALDLIAGQARPTDLATRDPQGRFTLLWSGLTPEAASQRLRRLTAQLSGHLFKLDGQLQRFGVVSGAAGAQAGRSADQLRIEARAALAEAEAHPERSPVVYRPGRRDLAQVAAPAARRRARAPRRTVVVGASVAGLGALAVAGLASLLQSPAPVQASVPRTPTPVFSPPQVIPAPPVDRPVPTPLAPAPPLAARTPAVPAPAPATPAAPSRDQLALNQGRQLARAFYAGQLDRVWSTLRPSVRAEWTDLAAFQAYRAQGRAAYGAETRVLREQVTRNKGVTYYTRTATFERGPRGGWTLIVGLDAGGKVREFGIVGADLLPDLQASADH